MWWQSRWSPYLMWLESYGILYNADMKTHYIIMLSEDKGHVYFIHLWISNILHNKWHIGGTS